MAHYWLRRYVIFSSIIALRQCPSRVGNPKEFKVVVRVDMRINLFKQLINTHRSLYGTEPKCRNSLQRHLCDGSQGT